nr:MAG TPA: hypothetical protein [Caudoviricetes sp.]
MLSRVFTFKYFIYGQRPPECNCGYIPKLTNYLELTIFKVVFYLEEAFY